MKSRDYRICSTCGVEYNALSPKSHECEEQDIEWTERMDAQIAEQDDQTMTQMTEREALEDFRHYVIGNLPTGECRIRAVRTAEMFSSDNPDGLSKNDLCNFGETVIATCDTSLEAVAIKLDFQKRGLDTISR